MQDKFGVEGKVYREEKKKADSMKQKRQEALQEWEQKLQQATQPVDKPRDKQKAEAMLVGLRGMDPTLRAQLEAKEVNVDELLDLGLVKGAFQIALEKAARQSGMKVQLLKNALNQERKHLSQQQKLQDSAEWFLQCKDTLGKTSATHLQRDSPTWDVFKLVQILAGHLLEVFVPSLNLGNKYQAKNLLNLLLELQQARTLRAHAITPTAEEVLDSLQCMKALLLLFRQPTKAQEELEHLLLAVQGLVRKAERTKPQNDGKKLLEVSLRGKDAALAQDLVKEKKKCGRKKKKKRKKKEKIE